MNFDRIIILIAKDNKRGKLTGRAWKVLLNRLGVGQLYRRPKDINLFKAFLDARQYTCGEHAEDAVKFFFAIQGVRRVAGEGGDRFLVADLARRVSSQAGYKTIGTVSLNLKTNQFTYQVDAAVEEEGLDYAELMARAIEDFERERVVHLSEITVAAEKLLARIGFNNGPEWFVADDGEALKTLRELAARVYEWGYDFEIDEIDLGDLKKSSTKHAAIEKQAYDYVWNDIKRRTKTKRRISLVTYRGVRSAVDKLLAENKICVRNGNITVQAGVLDGPG